MLWNLKENNLSSLKGKVRAESSGFLVFFLNMSTTPNIRSQRCNTFLRGIWVANKIFFFPTNLLTSLKIHFQ